MRRSWLGMAAGGLMALWGGMAVADQPAQDFPTWLQGVKTEALSKGIHQGTLDAALENIQPIDRVLELDRKQPEFTLTFEQYLARVVTPQRITLGRQLIGEDRKILAPIAKKYGVPARQIVAMWGIETDFGRLTGGFNVLPALATLAYDGRRSQYFRGEMMNALTIIDRGLATPSQMRGSWAGAMGQCQFMPSTYLKYAQDWTGAGKVDIWTNLPDVFASAANYLSGIGWNPHEGWGRPVRLPKNGIAPALIGLEVHHTLREWSKLGLRLPDGKALPKSMVQASLIRAETGKGDDVGVGQPYLVYDNFRVLMKWNHSIFFALASGTLADRIGNR